MKRALIAEVNCLSCGDKRSGVILISLASVVENGGPAHVELCDDCAADVGSAASKANDAKVISLKDAASDRNDAGNNAASNGNNHSVSDLPSGSSLSLNLGADPERARVKRGAALEYSLEFERLWAGCAGKKGNKHPASKAFDALNRTGIDAASFVDNAIAKWALWMSTDSWKRGFSKHLATWLNARGFNDVPDPSEFRPSGAGAGRPPGYSAVRALPAADYAAGTERFK